MQVSVKYTVDKATTPAGREYLALIRLVLVDSKPTTSTPILRFKTDDEALLFKAYLESMEGKKK